MRLSDALRFSRIRRAEHPGESAGLPITGTDYGIECISIHQLIRIALAKNHGDIDGETVGWSEMQPAARKRLLQSEQWEPIDPKPAMVIIAEAAADWSADEPDQSEEPLEEEGYYA